ncbi:SusC/RagA family TonB-linked outer membrane protein [uncultured Bacteroides sp.]|uniref:SusC/RagA family TonB-linked outer membrane protein n=1 Tax=uncultured Bacteroides sp. TaxID=162156 RepID=UPI0035A61191
MYSDKVHFSQAITLANAQPLKIVMGEDTKVLDEVVVTALGIKRSQKALSYNVQEVKGDELTTVKDANFMNSLAGKVAGVNINASSSGIGGATRVVMRGTKSISANNNALYVIDGVPIFNTNNGETNGQYSTQPKGEGISDINPEDIESMSVLSGPAAAALYGSNAAQGVILITTKKGKEGKARVTISNNSTFSRPFIMPEFQNSYINKAGSFQTWGEKGISPFGEYDPKDFFNTGTNIQNTISLSVGNKNNQTYFSAGTTNSQGIIPNSKYDRYNFTVRNTTSFLNDKMTLDVGFSYIIQEDRNLIAQGEYFNPLPAVYLFPRGENFDTVRMYQEYDNTRKINVQNWAWGDPGYSMQNNPYWVVNNMNHGTKKQRYMANASLKYQILDWLDIIARVRIDNANSDFTDKRNASTDSKFTASSIYGFYKYSKTDDRQAYADAILNINKRFGDFSIAANIGGSFTQTYNNERGFQGPLKDMSNVFSLYNMDTTLGNDTYPIENGWKQRTNSVFVSAEFGWKSMLYLTATGRNDWDSALRNTEQLSFFYPSIGLSGVISEMIKLPKFVSYLKIRGSFASVGSAIPRNLTSTWKYEKDPATSKWVTTTYRPLPKLYPEQTNSWEAGLSAKLFNNSLSLEVTWYKSNTKKQTLKIPLSASAGYAYMYAQSGNVQNTGMEFSLGYNKKWGDFGWNSNVTFSFNNNKIVELLENYVDEDGTHYSLSESDQGGIGPIKYLLRKGGTMGDIYTTNRLKRDAEGNILVDAVTHNVKKEDIKSSSDYVKLGSVLPKSNLGFRNDFSYKGFNIGFMLAARFGGVVISPTQAVMDAFGVSKESATARDNGGIGVNYGKVDVQTYYTETGGISGLLSNYVYSATNVRLQEASVGYSFPTKWFNNKLNLSLSVVGHNLWMIYNKALFDPELTASTGTYFQGVDYFMQPSQRNIGFNVKIQF